MDLRWWPVAAVGSGCFVVAVVLAAVLPMTAARRRLRPLANIARLFRLPEYAKVARLRSLSTIVTLVVLTVMFGAATWAASRPAAAGAVFDAAAADDVMLCVGQPLPDRATVDMLDYFAQQAGSWPQTQRIGLTSVNRRLVPLTRDLQYAVSRFGEYTRAPRLQSASFAPAVPYTDYATSVEDVLALCISGFPQFEQRDLHRRSVIYLGPSDLRAPGERRAALFTGSAVRELAERAGVRLNVVDTAPSPKSGSLLALTEQTGGRYLVPGSVVGALDDIRRHTGSGRRDAVAAADAADEPVLPLAIALVSATVLSVALMGLRR